MKSEAVPFPAVTLCNFRNLDFRVINRINELMAQGSQQQHNDAEQDYGTVEDVDDYAATDEDYDSPEYVPDDQFEWEYLKYVANLSSIVLSDRHREDSQVLLAIQVNSALHQYGLI